MNHSRSVAAVVAAAALVVGTVTLTRAGDLEPPAGAVKPTMHSLDEVFNAVGAIQGGGGGGSGCGPGVPGEVGPVGSGVIEGLPGQGGSAVCRVFSVSHGATFVPAAGGGGGGGTVTVEDFTFTKSVDASSPRLFRAATLGVHMPTLTITISGVDGDHFTYTLTDVLVRSLSEQVVFRCDGYLTRGERVIVSFRTVEYRDLTTGNSWNYDTQTHTGSGT